MLNSNQIIEEGLLKLDNSKGKKSQVGYDLSLKEVNKVGGELGKVFKDKTIINKHNPVDLTTHFNDKNEEVEGWLLEPGVYDFVMNEGCTIPDNRVAFIKQRSSLMRNGTIMQSSVFDPGFETENIGSYCVVNLPIFIEKNARVAQIYFHECEPVNKEDLYDGQFNGDKWRNS